MSHTLRRRSYALTPIAETGDRFSDFSPYVPSINDAGVVAFQAALRDAQPRAAGGAKHLASQHPTPPSAVCIGSGGAISIVTESRAAAIDAVCSHPDVNRAGAICFYARPSDAGAGQPPSPPADALFRLQDGAIARVAQRCGPLGPTMNDAGTIAFRAALESGAQAICAWNDGTLDVLAATGDEYVAFHGLPVVNAAGAVAFRADRRDSAGIFVGGRGGLRRIVETGERFTSLGQFPMINDAGAVAFCGTLRDTGGQRGGDEGGRGQPGWTGLFIVSDGRAETAIDTSSDFESFRGVLLDDAGRVVFYATPRGGRLGVFSGPDPRRDGLIGLGAELLGSEVTDFALNPVSINAAGQLALRVTLADGRQLILRADPVDDAASRPGRESV